MDLSLNWGSCERQERRKKGVLRAAHTHTPFSGDMLMILYRYHQNQKSINLTVNNNNDIQQSHKKFSKTRFIDKIFVWMGFNTHGVFKNKMSFNIHSKTPIPSVTS